MQTFLSEHADNRTLLRRGASMVRYNKRYVFWFYVLNATLAAAGTAAFRNQAHAILDHSLYAAKLVRGFDLAVLAELLGMPDFGSTMAPAMPAIYCIVLFFLLSALFMPGVFQGFAATYRLPREDFFRACGRNLWRFVRLLIISGIVMTVVAGVLFGVREGLVKALSESTNELLPFEIRATGLVITLLVMTTLRIWFDLAEADIVLDDQRAVRKSIRKGFRSTFHSWGRLLGSYVVIAIVAGIIVVGGLWVWLRFVRPENVFGAFLVGQLTMLLLLVPRFWQRGVAVAYWQREMLAPVVEMEPVSAAVASPEAEPVIPPLAPVPPSPASEI